MAQGGGAGSESWSWGNAPGSLCPLTGGERRPLANTGLRGERGERGEDARLRAGLWALAWLFPLTSASARGSEGVPGRVGALSCGELMSAVRSWTS